jgi:DNA-binding NarL/FixJ family response regulator
MPEMRHDLRFLLELPGSVEVVGEAANSQEAILPVANPMPDMGVMDLDMPITDGYVPTRRIQSSLLAPREVIQNVQAKKEEQKKSLAAEADALAVKCADYEMLLNTIFGKDDPHYLKN